MKIQETLTLHKKALIKVKNTLYKQETDFFNDGYTQDKTAFFTSITDNEKNMLGEDFYNNSPEIEKLYTTNVKFNSYWCDEELKQLEKLTKDFDYSNYNINDIIVFNNTSLAFPCFRLIEKDEQIVTIKEEC